MKISWRHIGRLLPALATFALVLASVPRLAAQMQPQVRWEGKLLAVEGFSADECVVRDERGRKHDTLPEGLELRPGPAFAPGFVRVDAVEVDLDPLRNESEKKRSEPNSVRFRYRARVTSDTPLKSCYGLLTFVASGSFGAKFVAIGSLGAGDAKALKVEMTNRVDQVGKLHIFTAGTEVKGTDVPEAYDVNAYVASLRGGGEGGVSAVELVTASRRFPHALSRDGRSLATVRERDTHNSLIIYDLVKMNLVHDINLGERGNAWDLTWISNTELAYVGTDRDGYTALMLLDATTGKSSRHIQNVSRLMAQLKRKPEQVRLFGSGWKYKTGTILYDLREREILQQFPLEEGRTYLDDEGHQRIRYVVEGKNQKCYYLPTRDDSIWKPLDAAVAKSGLIFDRLPKSVLERNVEIQSVGRDFDTLYIAFRGKSDRFELAEFSLSEARVRRTIAAHPKVDLSSESGTRLYFRKDSSELIGMSYETDRMQVAWLDPKFAAVQKAVDRAVPGHVNQPLDWSVDEGTFIYHSYSDIDPGTYYVFRPADGALIALLDLGES